MPKLEPKAIQKELEAGKIRPVYWLCGAERMKTRELTKRIRLAVLPEGTDDNTWGNQTLDGTETSTGEILDSAFSLSLGQKTKFLIIQNAEQIKDVEDLEPLLQQKPDELASVCVFASAKDLDMRRKSSKLLIEKAAVVPCEEVSEQDREAWIQYLAKRRELKLTANQIGKLLTLDPWSLEMIDQELEKYEGALAAFDGNSEKAEQVLSGFLGDRHRGTEAFLDAFFSRQKKKALECIARFAEEPGEALPLLGLLSWYTRQLALAVKDRETGSRSLKINPYLAEKLNRWQRSWKLSEIVHLQSALAEIDFDSKQTRKHAMGLWTNLVGAF